MLVYGGNSVLEHFYFIAPTQFFDKFLFLECLIVGNHLAADIKPIGGTFLEHAALNANGRIARIQLGLSLTNLEDQRVDEGIVALGEHPTLETHLHGILVELRLHKVGPAALVLLFLQGFLHLLQQGGRLCLKEGTCIVGLIEGISFLVLLEITLEGSSILGSRFPDLTLTDLIEQQAVVVFLNEVLQFLVLGSKMFWLRWSLKIIPRTSMERAT